MGTPLNKQLYGKSVSQPGKPAPYVIVNPNGSVSMNLDNTRTVERILETFKAAQELRKILKQTEVER